MLQKKGYTFSRPTEFENILINKSLNVDGLIVNVGESTDLHGWFRTPVLFCGFLETNEAIFYLGEGDSNLFNKDDFYYDVTYILATNRIGKS